MNIQWFPGHMAKTKRVLSENLKLVDAVIELTDARIPNSGRNPEIEAIACRKPRILALNKADLADEKLTREWTAWYASEGLRVIPTDSVKGTGINELKSSLRNIMKDRFDRDREKGRLFRPIRTMVVGIPNVGKSSFINRVAGRSNAATGDKPGITKTKQWIRINEEIELLDTPGILWPKFEDETTGMLLAFTGAIKDDILDTVGLAVSLLDYLMHICPSHVVKRYKLENKGADNGAVLLEEAGRNRGCLVSGGEVDLSRAAAMVLDEFRGGRLGRVTLEKPPI